MIFAVTDEQASIGFDQEAVGTCQLGRPTRTGQTVAQGSCSNHRFKCPAPDIVFADSMVFGVRQIHVTVWSYGNSLGPIQRGRARRAAVSRKSGAPRTRLKMNDPGAEIEPQQLMPFADQVEAKRQSYIDRGVAPPPVLPTVSTAISRNLPSILAAGGGLTALGVGAYGLGRGLSSGAPQPQPQPIMPQDEEQQLRQMLDEEMRMPAPQQMPIQQQIPAGSPPPSNSTLMRVMQSRSV